MPFNFTVGLPGPFSYSQRIGGKRSGGTLGDKFAVTAAQRESSRQKRYDKGIAFGEGIGASDPVWIAREYVEQSSRLMVKHVLISVLVTMLALAVFTTPAILLVLAIPGVNFLMLPFFVPAIAYTLWMTRDQRVFSIVYAMYLVDHPEG